MPAARGTKRAASKSSVASTSAPQTNKKKRTVVQLEVPSAPTRRGLVLTCGQGDVGQLGLGEDVVETTRFKHVTALGDKIVSVCAGGMHTIALDSSGKVWTFGCNDEGALGRPTSGEADEGTPAVVALSQRAVAVAAGDSHSAALLASGDVYAWGAFRDSHGSMGLVMRGREGKACREPVKVDVPERAAAVASGGDHLVVLTVSGAVYTMGCGEQGQLGRLAQRSASRETRQGFAPLLIPTKVALKSGASKIWAGYHATFALDANADKMFAWGLNNYGQLGITGEKRKTALFSPTPCDAFAAAGAWRGVACGQHHSLALDGAGRVLAVGRCEYGRLGLGERSTDAEALEPVPRLQDKKCISIATGTCNSFAVTDSGEVLAWGMGSEGQLGTGACADAPEPTPCAAAALKERTPLAVSAGGQHAVLLVEDLSAKKEASPTPEPETSEQKAADKSEEEEEEPAPEPPKKAKGRATKRQKKQEQEEEISSTSAGDSKPQKVNGDEKIETPMEVDETDNPQPKTTADVPSPKPPTTDDSTIPETTDTSSQDTVESAPTTESSEKSTEPVEKSTEPLEKSTEPIEKHSETIEGGNDVDMLDKAEVNGTPESPIVEKTVDSIQTDAPMTA